MQIGRFFEQHGIALCSFFVAALSLGYTIHAQRVDAEYKEAAIRPNLDMLVYPTTFEIGFHNNGLGPAMIERVSFRLRGRCYDSKTTSEEEFRVALVDFGTLELNPPYELLRPVFASLKPPKFEIVTFKNSVYPGQVIRSDEIFDIRKLEERYLQQVAQANASLVVETENKFRDAIYKLPIAVRYCSMTGRTCGVARMEDPKCVTEE